MKRAHLQSQKVMEQRDALLSEAVRRREEAQRKWRNASPGERDRRWAELVAATNAELRAGSW